MKIDGFLLRKAQCQENIPATLFPPVRVVEILHLKVKKFKIYNFLIPSFLPTCFPSKACQGQIWNSKSH